MSDLDLVPFTDAHGAPGGGPGRHRRRRRPERSGAGKTLIALGVVVVVLGGLVFGAWWGVGKVKSYFAAADYPGPGGAEVLVVIKDNETVTDIGNTLFRSDVVKSAKAFVNAAADEPRSQSLQPGTFKLKKQMKAADALTTLLDPSSKVTSKVTIREGLTVKETLALLAKGTKIPLADFQAAVQNPAALGVPDWAGRDPAHRVLEGFLFPQTYFVQPGQTATGLLREMVQNAVAQMTADGFVGRAESAGLAPWDLLKVASLVEQEGAPKDFTKVARVVYNRLNSTGPLGYLQFDSTTQYWLILTGKGRKARVTTAELKNPRNNYSTAVGQVRGLPPTPISNPDAGALRAAAEPAPGNWTYFVVTGKDGSSSFTNDYNVHLANVQKCKEIGRC